jgi:hypothetical protein
VFVCVGPGVCEISRTDPSSADDRFVRGKGKKRGGEDAHFATFWTHIGKRVEDMSQFVSREILGVVVASINGLYQNISQSTTSSKHGEEKYPVDKIRHRLESRHVVGNNCRFRTCAVVEAVVGKESCSNGAEDEEQRRAGVSLSCRHSVRYQIDPGDSNQFKVT